MRLKIPLSFPNPKICPNIVKLFEYAQAEALHEFSAIPKKLKPEFNKY
jgi:hypothetical protein